ncbi:heavy-metal-associated domain-containing protein [Mucilaginibacter flavus]|uniref:heavy-metal-associated domain-containing protein n=1 Tax=Mucilaginibacter flavus TaxID=931504 RepID=UPI0025B37807|nr:heavy metal-associated domain-containing protein [Mucilaginibacter flavus]MDN3581655.1 heavy metal-associated domain-containing protein [Mucilaginibacter flavus]
MKTLKIFILILLLSATVAKAQFTKAELQVSGLTCALCAKSTEKALRTLPFVGDIKTDLIRNTYLITFKNDVPVNFEQISKKVQGSGFSVNSLKATYNFDNTKVANNLFSYGGDTYKLLGTADKTTGNVEFIVVDQGFAPKSVSKKYLGQVADTAPASGRIYHLAI